MTSDLPILKRSRGYLPHWECGGGPYFVTFRQHGAIPAKVVRALQAERDETLDALRCRRPPAPAEEWDDVECRFSSRLDEHLDAGHGECRLGVPCVADCIVRALRHFDGDRYRLHAWCVMPNHVHVVFSIRAAWGAVRMGGETRYPGTSPLSTVLHAWKSFTSKEVNACLGRTGVLWQREYYDRVIRTERDFARCVEYTLRNPLKAGLCEEGQWPWAGLGLVAVEAVAMLREEWQPSVPHS